MVVIVFCPSPKMRRTADTKGERKIAKRPEGFLSSDRSRLSFGGKDDETDARKPTVVVIVFGPLGMMNRPCPQR